MKLSWLDIGRSWGRGQYPSALCGLAEQRQWIEDKLGMSDRITGGGARVVHKLADLGEILERLRKQFGDEKATAVEEFLLLQEHLVIKRKTLDKLPDEKMRSALEKEMADIREKMEEKRLQVGSYVMVAVRNIFLEDSSLLRGSLEAHLQQRAEKEGGSKTTMFASLEQRMNTAKANSKSTEG